ncbi:hypothetical protein ACNF5F_27170, partial [Escherichia coli]|uniref:hypothetical protein n=1 Tax=Escherichia coli TaxID=562 RepID=UPI003BA3BA72
CQWGQVHEPDPIREVNQELFRRLDRQARLATAASANKRQESDPICSEQKLPDLLEFVFTSHKARQLQRQVAGD